MANTKGYKGFGGSTKVMKVAGGGAFMSQSRKRLSPNEGILPGQNAPSMAKLGNKAVNSASASTGASNRRK